jgi:hypothetical protein
LKFEDIKVNPEEKWGRISLRKLLGQIKDIEGYLGKPFGDSVDIVLSCITFRDGTEVHISGEHDCPYLEGYKNSPANFDEKLLNKLYEESEKEA